MGKGVFMVLARGQRAVSHDKTAISDPYSVHGNSAPVPAMISVVALLLSVSLGCCSTTDDIVRQRNWSGSCSRERDTSARVARTPRKLQARKEGSL